MNQQIFVKQNHKDIKIAFLVLYLCLFIVITISMIVNRELNWGFIVFLTVTLVLFVCMIKLYDTYGIYVDEEKIFYRTFKRKEIDISTIVGVKIIKSEGQVNLAWSSFDIKDKKGLALYSMMFLSNIEDEMVEYPYGDIEFLRKYRKSVIMYSVYDERLIAFLKERKSTLKIIE